MLKRHSSGSKGRSSNNAGTSSSSASSSTSKPKVFQNIITSSPDSETTVVIPHIKTQDNAKVLPKYTLALSKSRDEDLVSAEDLDAIQLELELLLSTAALRYRVIRAESDVLDKAEDSRRERKAKYIERGPSSPGRKKQRIEEKPLKAKDSKHLSGQKIKKATTGTIASSPVPSQQTDDSMDALPNPVNQKDNPKINLPKNDTPNKFWLSVEPYCMPITQEDIKLLDDLIEEYSGALIPPIPDLGPHYSTKWAVEDLREEQNNSSAQAKKRGCPAQQSGEVIGMLKKGEKLLGDNITGPLTQRLVSALMEENLIPEGRSGENSSTESETSSRPSASLMKNGISIERRVKKELIEQGLLDDPEDFSKPHQDDEILSEIKKVRTELASIADFNCTELKKIHSLAKEEMKRLEIKRKLDVVDHEIIETYKKVAAAKQKRRPLTQQEISEVFRLTEEQKRLSDQLETLTFQTSVPHDM